jgi:endonuclease G
MRNVMKNKVLLIIALLGMMVLLSGTSSPKIKIIDKGWYRVGYSEIYREPVWVEYTVLCSVSNFSRKGIGFYPEPGVKTSVDADYVNNQWDKGHMAPAADFSCDSLALHSTFSYVNCALQQ